MTVSGIVIVITDDMLTVADARVTGAAALPGEPLHRGNPPPNKPARAVTCVSFVRRMI